MKSRRDFLAALGLGATALALPGTAQAWGGRRRRYRDSSCEPCYTPCRTDGYGCSCACPIYEYTSGNNMYYYACICCDTMSPINTGTMRNYGYTPNKNCADKSDCIGACAWDSCSPLNYRATSWRPETAFFLDPKATYIDPDDHLEKKHAELYINGINKSRSADLDKEFSDSARKLGTLLGTAVPVTFRDDSGKQRCIALYDMTNIKFLRDLHIGHETSDTPVSAIPLDTLNGDKWGQPVATLQYYWQITHGGHLYHVVSGK